MTVRLLRGVAIVAAISAPRAQAPATGTIVGRLYDNAGGVGRTSIVAKTAGPGPVFVATTDNAGRYRIDVPAGRYRVVVPSPLLEVVTLNNIVVAGGRELEVNLHTIPSVRCECVGSGARQPDGRPGELIGRAVDGRGFALPFAEVTVTGPASLPGRARGYCDQAGWYGVSLPPGDYTVRFVYPGFQPATLEHVRVDSDRTATASAELQVSSQNQPLPDVERRLTGSNCGSVFGGPESTLVRPQLRW